VEEVLVRVQTHLSLQAMRETLHVQNELLQAQNEEMEAFAHTVAHDLKSPLFTIVGFLELLREDMAEASEEAQPRLSMSIGGTYKLNNIIDELLLLASVRKEEVDLEPVDMMMSVDRALERLGYMIEKYQPEIILPDSWPAACGYAPWIEEVWVNYLSNGLKYGGQQPRLELDAAPQADGTVRFWVRDNGPGLDAEAQASLFTEFTRLDRVRAQGHGLGLSIVRRIMDKLDGHCGVESAPGQGSEFFFTLPPY
jgi:signal transduction histidine kinase